MKRVAVHLLLVATLLVVGCKTTRRVTEVSTMPTEMLKDDKARFEAAMANAGDYQSFSSRVNLSVRFGTKVLNSSGSIKIVRDRILWFSLQPMLGIEAARIMITPDSLFVLNTLDRQYAAESLEKYKRNFPLDISLAMVESLFLNRIFIPGEEPVAPDDSRRFRYRYLANQQLEISPRREREVKSRFTIDNQNRLTETNLSMPQKQIQLAWSYDGFNRQSDRYFPARLVVDFKRGNSSKTESASITYSRMEWNAVGDVNVKIPSRYKQVPLEKLIESIKNR